MLVLLVFTSCQKEETTNTLEHFVEKPFYPTDAKDATASVKAFLPHTATFSESPLKSDYPNTEVNEGEWLLEAASNYLSNINLDRRSDEIVEYTVEISNLMEDGILKMSGSDMVFKFDELFAQINLFETENNKLVKLVDLEISEANSTTTIVSASILYALLESSVPLSEWEWPTEYLQVHESAEVIKEYLNSCYIPNIIIESTTNPYEDPIQQYVPVYWYYSITTLPLEIDNNLDPNMSFFSNISIDNINEPIDLCFSPDIYDLYSQNYFITGNYFLDSFYEPESIVPPVDWYLLALNISYSFGEEFEFPFTPETSECYYGEHKISDMTASIGFAPY